MRLRPSALGALLLGTLLFAVRTNGEAQQPTKPPPRIGFLCWIACAGPYYEAFWERLRDLGYADYRNIGFVNRHATGDHAILQGMAHELVSLKVDVIVADTTVAAMAAKNATGTIPIVAITDDPVRSGLVASLARPGGSVTGVSLVTSELSAKRLELLKDVIPTASRVGILWTPGIPAIAPTLAEMEVVAPTLGLTIHFPEGRRLMELDRALVRMTNASVDALIVFTDTRTMSQPELIVRRVLKSRLPAMYDHTDLVAAGGLMAYGASVRDLYRRAALYVDKVLRGAKPADLPVERPARFEFVINMKTAKALGLTIPPSVLVRADKVIDP